jgi:F-type H+-transporting ATPase subunit a
MPEHELWVTTLFNELLAGPAIAALNMVGKQPADPSAPWSNAYALQVFVFLLLVVGFWLARRTFSTDNPSRVQTILELFVGFIRGQAEDMIDHHPRKHVAFFGTLFVFIAAGNLLGVLPTLESPTMFAVVPLGAAVVTFLYYQLMAMRDAGLWGWFKHYLGPVWWLSWLMFPIEILSHTSRLLSLTVRLFANMFAHEMVFLVFLGLIPFGIPIIFMSVHLFVALLQAYIFTLLSMVYLGQMVSHEH